LKRSVISAGAEKFPDAVKQTSRRTASHADGTTSLTNSESLDWQPIINRQDDLRSVATFDDIHRATPFDAVFQNHKRAGDEGISGCGNPDPDCAWAGSASGWG
jgi:hypothetical protein